MTSHEPSTKKEIRNLLAVAGSAVAAAFIIVGFFLYNYGPSGRYQARNALVDPEVAETLAFNDNNPKTNGVARYIFDGFLYLFHEKTEQKSLFATADQYKRFYDAIRNDESLAEVPREVEDLFLQGNYAKLIVQVRTESHASWIDNTKPLQQLHFSPDGNYYRVELREQNVKNKWVYFHHSGISKDAQRIFIPQ